MTSAVPLPLRQAAGDRPSLLAIERDRAERLLNAVRLVVLLLLAAAALAYATTLPPALNRVNLLLLIPTIAWTIGQYALFYDRPMLPAWLALANPVVDVIAVTTVLGAYGFAAGAELALKTPIFGGYFIILAALPVASSTRKAAAVSALAVTGYGGLVAAFFLSGGLTTVFNPVQAAATAAVSPLDEGAKLLLLACAGAVATYATHWQERLSRRYDHAARASEQLQTRLDQARLQALKLQLQPHFLFNTLNTITALVHTDPPAAERMVSGLSELLRMSLGTAGEQEVPLERELDVLRHYLDIQQVRFQDRLSVSFDVDGDAPSAYVPNLLLQPLVENAIKHGIGPRAAAGHIAISARRRNGVLALEVSDDGVGAPEEAPPADGRREGVGLGNSRARLQSLYGNAHRFEAGPGAAGGYRVYIEIPFLTAPHAPRGDATPV
ncbi:MAG TPA: sensor histidine kinase [Gemmatimonadaceae bacterium]|nr:sensor histidine kinase [Gemmatimonadaceae bacterium]